MAGDVVGFYRKNGQVIPLHGKSGRVAPTRPKANRLAQARKIRQSVKATPQKFKVRYGMAVGATALSIAEGVATGLSWHFGPKVAAAAHTVGFGVEAASTALAAGAYAGKGHVKKRLKGFAILEATDHALGWGAYGATLLAQKSVRQNLAKGVVTGVAKASKILAMGRKALGVMK